MPNAPSDEAAETVVESAVDAAQGESAAGSETSTVLHVSLGSTSRTVLPNTPSAEQFSSFTLTGTKADGEAQTLGTYESYASLSSATIPVLCGEWSFTLTAQNGALTYTGTTTTVIVPGENNVAFALSLAEAGTGNGNLAVTLDWAATETSVKRAKGGLYSVEDDTAVTGYPSEFLSINTTARSVTYAKQSVPVGTYRLRVTFYADQAATVKIASYSELVCIAESLTSSAKRSISFTDVYKITYNLGGGALAAGATAQEQCSRYNPQITLPRLTRTGYTFAGWATTSGSGAKVYDDGETLTATGNMTVYAKWEMIEYTVTVDNIDSVDLSTALYIKVQGAITQEFLQTLAEKLESDTVAFTLDLSTSSGLTTIERVTDIYGDYRSYFENTKIQSVILPEGLATLGAGAFSGCKDFANVTIPSSVVTIKRDAFSYTNLREIKIPV